MKNYQFLSPTGKKKINEVENYVKLTKSPMTDSILVEHRYQSTFSNWIKNYFLLLMKLKVLLIGFYIPGTKIPILPEAELFHKDEKPPKY